MNSFKKVLKSKTLKEAVINVPYSFIYTILTIVCVYFPISLVTIFVYEQGLTNRNLIRTGDCINLTLYIGIIFSLLFFYKRHLEAQKPLRIKAFIRKNTSLILFICFAVWIFISVAVNGFSKITINGDIFRSEGLLTFTAYISLFYIGYILNKTRYSDLFYIILSVVGFLLSVIYIINFCCDKDFLIKSASSMGFLHMNHYSYFNVIQTIMAGLIFTTAKNKWCKAISFIAFIAATVTVVINNTLGGYLAIICAFIFYIIVASLCKGRFDVTSIIPILLFIIILTVCAISSKELKDNIFSNINQLSNDSSTILDEDKNTHNHSTGELRLVLWKETIEFIKEKPIFGYGGETVPQELFERTQGACDRPHNEFLQYAFFYGIPAAVIYIVSIFLIYLKGLFNRKRLSAQHIIALCCVAGYLVSSVFGNTTTSTTPFMFIMLGMGYFKDE